MAYVFDAYYDSGWKSSDAGSNFGIYKFQDTIGLWYDSGIAKGSGVSWNTDGLILTKDGNVGIGTTTPTSILDIDKGTGYGQITVNGSSGGCMMFRDTDDAGWTECSYLNGTQTCTLDADGVCDGS